MSEKINRVDAVRSTSKVSAIRPFGAFDDLLNQSKPKKKQTAKPGQASDKAGNKETACRRGKDYIDCNV